jgi:hypothetical protein
MKIRMTSMNDQKPAGAREFHENGRKERRRRGKLKLELRLDIDPNLVNKIIEETECMPL